MSKNVHVLLSVFIISIAAIACGEEAERQDKVICTVEINDSSTTLRCPGEADTLIPHGSKGDKGDPGTPGELGPIGPAGPTGGSGGGSTGGVDCSVGFFGDIAISSDVSEPAALTALIDSGCTIIRGNVSISSLEPHAVFKTITRIHGNLNINGDTVGDISFPALTAIDGNLDLSESAIFRTTSFPALEEIGNSLLLVDVPSLTTLDSFPMLHAIGNRFIIAKNDNLTQVGELFQTLSYIGGDVYMYGNNEALEHCDIYIPIDSMPNFYGTIKVDGSLLGSCF